MGDTSSSGGGSWTSAAASGGMIIAPIIDTLISTNAAKKAQGRSIRYAKKESELAYQRDLEMLRMQNEYNSPKNQMARFAEAGLNPNLIYGQGNPGNQSSAPSYKPAEGVFRGIVPEFSSIIQGIGAYQDFSMKQAQIDNVKAHTDNVNQATSNSILEGIAKQIGIDTSSFNLKQKQELERYSQEAIRLRTGLLRQQHSLNIDRQTIMSREAEAAQQKPTQAKTKTETMQAELLFKQFENQFRKMGIQSGDNVLIRMMLRAFAENGFDPSIFFK